MSSFKETVCPHKLLSQFHGFCLHNDVTLRMEYCTLLLLKSLDDFIKFSLEVFLGGCHIGIRVGPCVAITCGGHQQCPFWLTVDSICKSIISKSNVKSKLPKPPTKNWLKCGHRMHEWHAKKWFRCWCGMEPIYTSCFLEIGYIKC